MKIIPLSIALALALSGPVVAETAAPAPAGNGAPSTRCLDRTPMATGSVASTDAAKPSAAANPSAGAAGDAAQGSADGSGTGAWAKADGSTAAAGTGDCVETTTGQ